jgi:alkylhydroperoxidase/carboxymuconolactone decarboxylase family protein YurZ
MYAPGTRRHIQAALDMGVTPEEILEVLKLATIVGIHSCNLGVPILVEEMAARRQQQSEG